MKELRDALKGETFEITAKLSFEYIRLERNQDDKEINVIGWIWTYDSQEDTLSPTKHKDLFCIDFINGNYIKTSKLILGKRITIKIAIKEIEPISINGKPV